MRMTGQESLPLQGETEAQTDYITFLWSLAVNRSSDFQTLIPSTLGGSLLSHSGQEDEPNCSNTTPALTT